MNSLILLPSELISETKARVEGDRRKYLLLRHEVNVGLELKGGILGGKRIRLKIESIDDDAIYCHILEFSDALPKDVISLVVGVSRPQTTKKLIHLACTTGVESLDFVMTERSEKSYLSSLSLIHI